MPVGCYLFWSLTGMRPGKLVLPCQKEKKNTAEFLLEFILKSNQLLLVFSAAEKEGCMCTDELYFDYFRMNPRI